MENIVGVGFHSLLHSNAVHLTGNILEKVKQDPTFLREQKRIVDKIKKNSLYKKEGMKGTEYFSTQLGGPRAQAKMWKQALEFWKWPTAHSATWKMACDELTWAVRSVRISCSYSVSSSGLISLTYSFTDTLDLRPDWQNRSREYNYLCLVLGFLYHDIAGGNDQLKVKADWKTVVN